MSTLFQLQNPSVPIGWPWVTVWMLRWLLLTNVSKIESGSSLSTDSNMVHPPSSWGWKPLLPSLKCIYKKAYLKLCLLSFVKYWVDFLSMSSRGSMARSWVKCSIIQPLRFSEQPLALPKVCTFHVLRPDKSTTFLWQGGAGIFPFCRGDDLVNDLPRIKQPSSGWDKYELRLFDMPHNILKCASKSLRSVPLFIGIWNKCQKVRSVT